jgi:hypothetical protein
MHAQNKYVGVKACKVCHQTKKQGKQFDIWQKSKHAKAFKVLSTTKADEITKIKGFKKSAAELPECLKCHTIMADAKLMSDGVQCESCHGAGSAYKNMAIMKDKTRAIVAGMVEFVDTLAIEQVCRSCHNKESPTYHTFTFYEMWEKMRHPVPKEK